MGISGPGKAERGRQGIHSVGSWATPQERHSGQLCRRVVLNQTYGLAARITDHYCLLETQLSLCFLRNGHHVRGDELYTGLAQTTGNRFDISGNERRLPMPEIV